MSAPALALAVRDTIIGAVKLNGAAIDTNTCDVGFDGSAKPGCGELYISVHLGGWKAISGDNDLHESFDMAVTVTRRLGYAPKDRYGQEIWVKITTGLDALCRAIATLIHKSQAVRNLANTSPDYGIGANAAGFHTPLWFTGAGAPTFRDYKWFTAKLPPGTEQEAAQAGVSQTITFAKAERCQAVAQPPT